METLRESWRRAAPPIEAGAPSGRSAQVERSVGWSTEGWSPSAHREVFGRKPQERKVSTAFARSTGPGTKRGLCRGARGEEGRCRRATARRYFGGQSAAEDLEDPSDRVGEPTPTSPARSRRERAKANEPATTRFDGCGLSGNCQSILRPHRPEQPHESGPRGHAACTEKL